MEFKDFLADELKANAMAQNAGRRAAARKRLYYAIDKRVASSPKVRGVDEEGFPRGGDGDYRDATVAALKPFSHSRLRSRRMAARAYTRRGGGSDYADIGSIYRR